MGGPEKAGRKKMGAEGQRWEDGDQNSSRSYTWIRWWKRKEEKSELGEEEHRP